MFDVPGMNRILDFIPDFDLYKLHKIIRLTLWDDAELGLVLEMDVVYAGRHVCSIRLESVRDLRTPEMVMSMPSLSELEVEDIRSDGLEGIAYRLRDVGPSGGFACFCREIRFTRLGHLSETGEIDIAWNSSD